MNDNFGAFWKCTWHLSGFRTTPASKSASDSKFDFLLLVCVDVTSTGCVTRGSIYWWKKICMFPPYLPPTITTSSLLVKAVRIRDRNARQDVSSCLCTVFNITQFVTGQEGEAASQIQTERHWDRLEIAFWGYKSWLASYIGNLFERTQNAISTNCSQQIIRKRNDRVFTRTSTLNTIPLWCYVDESIKGMTYPALLLALPYRWNLFWLRQKRESE